MQDHIDFTDSGEIGLYDYYHFYLVNGVKRNHPTEVLSEIGKLPKDSLNEKWKEYYAISEMVNEDNQITGKTLTECIQNADKIYKIADELKKLKF